MNQRDLANVLLLKAKQDLVALEALLESKQVADETIGFHAQQAVEKAIKAVLARDAVRFPRDHDIDVLLHLLATSSVAAEDWMEDARALTPYAAILRYEDLLSSPRKLDRPKALEIGRRFVAWAETAISGSDKA